MQESCIKNGYKIYLTKNALNELRKTIQYLEANFSAKAIEKLAFKIEGTIALVSQNPNIFPKSAYKNIY